MKSKCLYFLPAIIMALICAGCKHAPTVSASPNKKFYLKALMGSDSSATIYTYDQAMRVAGKEVDHKNGTNETTVYRYNAMGQLDSAMETDNFGYSGWEEFFEYIFIYNPDGTLQRVNNYYAVSGNPYILEYYLNYHYNANKQADSISFMQFQGSGSFRMNYYYKFAYDSAGTLLKLTTIQNDTISALAPSYVYFIYDSRPSLYGSVPFDNNYPDVPWCCLRFKPFSAHNIVMAEGYPFYNFDYQYNANGYPETMTVYTSSNDPPLTYRVSYIEK